MQCIHTVVNYVIPLKIKSSLAYLTMHPYTDKEWDKLPHVIVTADTNWDPSIFDHNIDNIEEWFDALPDLCNDPTSSLFDEFGDYKG